MHVRACGMLVSCTFTVIWIRTEILGIGILTESFGSISFRSKNTHIWGYMLQQSTIAEKVLNGGPTTGKKACGATVRNPVTPGFEPDTSRSGVRCMPAELRDRFLSASRGARTMGWQKAAVVGSGTGTQLSPHPSARQRAPASAFGPKKMFCVLFFFTMFSPP